MKFLALACCALSAGLPAYASEYRLQLDPSTTKIHWTVGSTLHTVHGTFKLKSGEIRFDPESGRASGLITVDAASGESGGGDRDSRMHKIVLESAKYPEATFAPDRVEGKIDLSGSSSVRVHGTFTIHGTGHELTIPINLTAAPDRLAVKIAFDVPYVAWGMKDPGNFVLKVDKIVKMDFETSGSLAMAAAAGR